MQLVENFQEIKVNTEVIDRYLDDESMKDYALGLLKRGICFLVIEKNNEYRFYPSRFIGYKNNSQVAHDGNKLKDGTETNPAISKIVGFKPQPSEELENEYLRYCEKKGFTPTKAGAYGVKRKFWRG